MGKKILSLCMVLVLCLSLLPVTALAVETNTVYVGGVALTGSFDSIAYATTNENGEVITEGATAFNYNIKLDGSTLTLRNATIKKGLAYDQNTPAGSTIHGSAIGVLNQSGDAELTVQLEGSNTIDEVSTGIYVHSSGGGAALSITGNGTLVIDSTFCPIQVISFNGNAALSIENAKVTATSSYYNGVTVQSGNSENSSASLTVNGGSLTATASSANVSGISLLVGADGTGDCTPTVTVSNNAIVRAKGGSAGGITSNSSTGVQYGTGSSTTGGIVFDGNTGTVYGAVTLQEDLEIGEGESLTLDSGASLNTNGKLTVDGGTLTPNGTVTGDVTYKVTGVSLSPSTLNLDVGTSSTLTATVEPDEASNKNVTWSSEPNGIVTITPDTSDSKKVTITATGTGTTTIKATVDGKSAECSVTVTAPPEPEPEPEPTPPPYIPPTYAVTTPETPGGTVTVSPTRASSGRTVTITAAPDTGYELESLTVLDSRGNEIPLTDKGDGKYTFTMPASRVTVEASFTPAPLPFEDVAPGAWYEEAVRYAYFHNIMEGMRETEFAPATALTRAMAVQILYNLEGQPDLSDENLGYPYEDVDAQAWYGNAVYWARITGVATGYGDGTFQPGDSITRQEFAQMLYNYAKYKGYDLTAAGDLSQFPDSESVADWAEAAMRWANGNQLINGHDDGTIDAAGIGTRAQAASILMQFDQNLVEN